MVRFLAKGVNTTQAWIADGATVTTDLEQLIEAVRSQPGSRAYALLAARYNDKGEAEKARTVCEQGFAVNPAYERGAVVYLDTLRALSDIDRAAEVYGRAIAENPRSPDLRVSWAKILLDVGREYEARLRAREAVEIAPDNKDACALLSSLGGSVVARRTTSGISVDPNAEAADDHQSAGIRQKVAALRPRLQLSTTENKFDFTPGPEWMTPAPGQTGSPEAPGLGELADFFNVPANAPPRRSEGASLPPDAASPPPIPGMSADEGDAPPEMAEADIAELSHELEAELSQPAEVAGSKTLEDVPAGPPASPKKPSGLSPAVLPPVTSDMPRPDRSQERPRYQSQNLFKMDQDVVTGPGPTPDRLPPTPVIPDAPRQKRRAWPIVLLVLAALLLVTLPGVGVFIHFRWKAEALRKEVGALVRTLKADRLANWLAANKRLCQLAAERPESPALQVSCALALGHLAARFANERAAKAFLPALATARKVAPNHLWTHTATVLAGPAKQQPAAVRALEELPAEKRDWHANYAISWARLMSGRAEKALPPLVPLIRDGAAAATMALGARLARVAGKHALARRFVDQGLASAPQHVGLLVQQALLLMNANSSMLMKLRSDCSQIPHCLADVTFLEAHLAFQAGKRDAAKNLAERAATIAQGPLREATWQRGVWSLGPGGDVGQALAALEQAAPRRERLAPSSQLIYSRALLLAGKAARARTLLASPAIAKLEHENDRTTREVLRVVAAHALDDKREFASLCPRRQRATKKLIVCAHAAASFGALARIKSWTGVFPTKSDARHYLRGLVALHRGDAKRAEAFFLRQKQPSATMLMALAEAQSAQRKHQLAVATLRRATTQDSNSVRSRLALARALVAAGRDGSAQALLDSVTAAKPTDARALALLGRAYLTLGQAQRARLITKTARSLHPHSAALALLAAEVAIEAKELATAQRILRPLLKRDPRAVKANLLLAQITAAQGRLRRARHHFRLALKQRPKDPDLRLEVAIAYARARQYKSAWEHGSYAIKGFRRSGRDQRVMEAVLALTPLLRKGPPSALQHAADLLFEACKRKDAPASAFYEFGLVYRRQKEPKRAIWSFTKAIERDPKHAQSLLQLGLVQWSKRKWRKQAKKTFKRFLGLVPTGRQAKRVRRLLGTR